MINEPKTKGDAAFAEARKAGEYSELICTKPLYNYIDSGLLLGISNKDLLVKKDGKKRNYKRYGGERVNNCSRHILGYLTANEEYAA